MNNKNFVARNWFINSKAAQDILPPKGMQNAVSSSLAPFTGDIQMSQNSGLKSFFVPGWKGESLISKDVKKFIDTLNKFHQDASKYFSRQDELSRRIKISIYDEFLSFAEQKAINCTGLDHYTLFWTEINNKDSKYKTELSQFIEIMSFRIAVIYLLKVRFILILQEKSHLDFDIKSIYYPNAYLAKIFKTASSTELKTKVFDQNVFSWYRPSEELKNDLLKFKQICSSLQITDIIKTISIKSQTILTESPVFSHTLSHKRFGLFLNNLLINFPVWLNSVGPKKYSYKNHKMEILSTKFAGDYMESMALSHWLAQATNQYIKWDKILCPDFKKLGFDAGLYLKSIHELQFLSFLAEISHEQGENPISFVSHTINSHLYNRKQSNELQRNLLTSDEGVNHSTYDRIVLNLVDFPKNNPQHFLFSKILEQKEFLKDSGHIYVLTSKKIFIPSQKVKIESLMKELKIEGVFSLEDVKGKGEIGSFIYIFSIQKQFQNHQVKHNCLNFRLSGNLETFQQFQDFTHLSQEFFNKNLNDLPPLFQTSLNGFRLEFFQDAIVNGQLIHSSSKDSSKITHPHFFKKLMNLCNPLDYFFDLQAINFNENIEENSLFFFSKSFKRDKAPYTIIVDQRAKETIRIEIILTSTLEAKSYEYGHALCHYFYAYPKWPNLSHTLIKNYLDSTIGQQVINLTFNNELRKVKGNLNKVLIPKKFLDKTELPEHISAGLEFLNLSHEQLLSLHPQKIETTYGQISSILPALTRSYPRPTLELLSHFNRTIIQCSEIIGESVRLNSLNFNNPILKSPLLMSKTFPIYPDNKDIFVEFTTDVLEKIHAPLSKVKQNIIQIIDKPGHVLELYAEDEIIVSIHSNEKMIHFLEFLMSNIQSVPISKILQGVKVPNLVDLESILSSYESLQKCLFKLKQTVPKEIEQLINSTILGEE